MTPDLVGLARAGRLPPLAEGHSHEVFVAPDGDAVVKVFTAPAREEHRREWSTLVALSTAAPGLAPLPWSADLEHDRPAIVMSLVPGQARRPADLDAGAMAALAAAHRAVHAVHPVAPARRAISHPATMLDRTRRLDAERCCFDDVPDARRWLASEEARSLASPPVEVLCRGDTNIRNVLWVGDRPVLVDFEDSGLSDPAFEVADLVEHVWARDLDAAAVAALLDASDLDAAARRRHRDGRRLAACFWLAVLRRRQERGEPPGDVAVEAQLERVRSLLADA